MVRLLTFLGSGVVLLVVILGLTFWLGMRANAPFVLDRVRRFNKAVTNRRVLRSAGTAGAPASVVRHVGRGSGRAYETPVEAMAVDDDFVIALPYGTRSDWLQNVLAAGSAIVVEGGIEYRIDEPAIVPTAEVLHRLPAKEQRMLRWFKVDTCLRARRVAAAQAPDPAGAQRGADAYG